MKTLILSWQQMRFWSFVWLLWTYTLKVFNPSFSFILYNFNNLWKWFHYHDAFYFTASMKIIFWCCCIKCLHIDAGDYMYIRLCHPYFCGFLIFWSFANGVFDRIYTPLLYSFKTFINLPFMYLHIDILEIA